MTNNIKTDLKWYTESSSSVIDALSSDSKKGLPREEHERRLNIFGYNKLEQKKKFRFWKLVWSQLKSPLVFILIVAGVVTIILGETTDTIVIFIAVGINTLVGIFQEGRASKAFERLRASVKKFAVVIRDGRQQEVEASTLVPGDIVIMQSGDQVPADVRLIEAKGLEVSEAILTGEWQPITKDTKPIKGEKRITEQTNMVWMGTLAEDGFTKGIVVETGQNTQLGKIAKLLAEEKIKPTPFQVGVKRLARIIGTVILAMILIIFILGVFRGEPFQQMFLTAVAIAVAAIPEGLPVAVTVILAISMSKILSKKGLVKKLVKAETLGSTSVILTDKTGTLTLGKMELAGVLSAASIFDGKEFQSTAAPEGWSEDEKIILKTGTFTSGAFIENPEEKPDEWIFRGKPTDKALLKAGLKSGFSKEKLEETETRLDYLPFDSERRLSVALHRLPAETLAKKDPNGKKNRLYITGAPEVILSFSDYYHQEKGKPVALIEKSKEKIRKSQNEATKKGMRVVATCYKDVEKDEIPRREFNDFITGAVFTGLFVFHDPVRADVADAIAAARDAGLRPIIVTGDHANTALSVAHEIGFTEAKKAITGEEMEKMDQEQLRELLKTNQVFARVLPHQKLDMVKALHIDREIVAMTGDGVNDAPALKQADIGVAVGSGTDVAKEASDLIMLNDNFNIIVKAIEEGRVILDNLRKVTAYLLSTGFSEVILIGAALIAGLPLPVLPVQILWANIVEEGFMNFALAFEPKEKDIMKRKRADLAPSHILNREMKTIIFGIGIITSLFLVILYLFLLKTGYPIEHIRTILFAGLSIDALFFVFALKSLRRPLWKINLASNYTLIGAFAISVLFLIGALTLPPFQKLLGTVTPSLSDVALILGLGIINLVAIEAAKWYFIARKKA